MKDERDEIAQEIEKIKAAAELLKDAIKGTRAVWTAHNDTLLDEDIGEAIYAMKCRHDELCKRINTKRENKMISDVHYDCR